MSAELFENRLSRLIGDKRVLVLGYGREGRSTHRVLTGVGGYSCLDVADSDPAVAGAAPTGVVITGEKYLDSLGDYDVVFKSPGIVLPNNVSSLDCAISSQTDLFLSEYSGQTIGVTGTKGKSTVATLLSHTLESAGYEAILAGNIGTPVFDIYDRVTSGTKIVVELSCHQLEYCEHSPSQAVLLNLFEDHLDHYGTFERYIRAKKNIYRYQSGRDTLYAHLDDLPISIQTDSRVRDVNAGDLPFTRFEDVGGVRLRGEHNLLNAAFAYNICLDIGVEGETFINALRSYDPLPHRLEFLGSKNGVDYYDDSISTTVESAVSAVKSVPNAKTLIIGGMDRGIDYTALVDFLLAGNLTAIIGMYDSGKRVREMYLARCTRSEAERFMYADDLYGAAELAQIHTLPGDACLLSPAAASYGDFVNFEERGNVFRRLIFDL